MISIVIPTCARPHLLEMNLQLLWPQISACSAEVEVIVTDDSSDLSTHALLKEKFPKVRWTQGPQNGPASNRNHGASLARGEWMIFLDDDVLPSDTFLKGYLLIFQEHPREVAFVGKTVVAPPCKSLLWEAPYNPDCNSACSCNWAFKKKFFEEIGGFDERFFPAFEDVELAARIEQKGYPFVKVPNALLIHPPRQRPKAQKLAARWEPKVIKALDYGASPATIQRRLPLHVFRVIQSRFRKQRMTADNRKALRLFAMEFFWVCWLTPGWIRKWKDRPRSTFWLEQRAKGLKVPKYGF